ncbi:MAG: glycoside hydrolase family 13 protein [Clostridia bacterium]|nr:glycoside hydrolase family 13 protein [Clostridia bacterium]
MRILYNSKELYYKAPFGTLVPKEACSLRILIPCSCETSAVSVEFETEDGTPVGSFPFRKEGTKDLYDSFTCTVSLNTCGLYFYWFRITANTGPFRLFKQGNDTNMEAGDRWQLSVIPENFTTPDWLKGAVIYQIFPDRFKKSGDCDLHDKLQPFILREDWGGQPQYSPNEKGEVLCNDFFGGNFRGITEKLEYIRNLGATVLYLNPIGMAFSNHRYDTADYKRPDPMLGTEEDFRTLTTKAHELGMHVILDGVYSHTGANSVYFDKFGIFGNGAVKGESSPYYSWYTFKHFPDKYECWWGFETLPDVRELDENYQDFIMYGQDSVLEHWLKLGADGFRLDVVDELPDLFVSHLKCRLRELRPDAALLGEVWEDASNKKAYDELRRYFTDAQLDSTMNYPWQKAIIRFCREEDDGTALAEILMTIAENYPPQVVSCLMNLLGSHDTARILTALVRKIPDTRPEQAEVVLSEEERALAVRRLHLASFLQFTLPGSPSIYYGDEAGMEGCKDPFNRACFPWGNEDQALTAWYQALGRMKEHPVLRYGDLRVLSAGEGKLSFVRTWQGRRVTMFVNRSDAPQMTDAAGTILFSENMQQLPNGERFLLPYGVCAIET